MIFVKREFLYETSCAYICARGIPSTITNCRLNGGESCASIMTLAIKHFVSCKKEVDLHNAIF